MYIKWMSRFSLNKIYLQIPAQLAMDLSGIFLKIRGLVCKKKAYKWRSQTWKGLYFSNPVGTAGGLDKSGAHTKGWWTYGPGFIEVGTITPKPQKANSGPIIKRDIPNQALWNHMGFPNPGWKKAVQNLKSISKSRHTPCFISIGKNRSTPLEDAVKDYLFLIEKLHPFADAFTVNLSSPNTAGLRQLLRPEALYPFLDTLKKSLRALTSPPPLLLKLSPDLSDEDFLKVIDESEKAGIDGWIVCNTTLDRTGSSLPPHGGLSGAPLAKRSKHLLSLLSQFLGDRKKSKLLISSGGVMNKQDVLERLNLGADLVQVYSILVFEGPSFFEKIQESPRSS